jgi:hypothetical protein
VDGYSTIQYNELNEDGYNGFGETPWLRLQGTLMETASSSKNVSPSMKLHDVIPHKILIFILDGVTTSTVQYCPEYNLLAQRAYFFIFNEREKNYGGLHVR